MFQFSAAPPLPPQDHPAFQINEFGVLPTATPSAFYADKVRPSYSLPSFRKWSRSSIKPGMRTIRTKGVLRHRSKSSIADNQRPGLAIPSAIHHSRTSSKTSIISIRRSSAEFSAKQATSLDHDGCWEVGVSKAIINLSLRDEGTRASTLTAGTADAFPEKPCGENRKPGDRILTLGSPFFLQNQLPHNFINNRVFNDNHASAKSRHAKNKHTPRDGIKLMAKAQVGENGQIVTTITTSSSDPAARLVQAKRQSSSESAGSSKSNSSRRGERRTRSSSSGTPPQRKVDSSQTHAFASIQSTLVVPQLSITRPTPEPSPISPISPTPARRTHHKSTPTMPPKSILPPVIEKSYSSGSVKRKADEADFAEGDKTPPKESKEHRATFAPESKSQRMSASSLLVHAPSSYNRSKRVRLTNSSEGGRSTSSKSGQRPNLPEESPFNSKNTGSWSSRGSHGPRSASSFTHTHSYREGPPPARSASRVSHSAHGHREPSRSLSQISIPISALVSPHAPSIAHSGTFHMRDPRKPAPIQNTAWSLSFPTHWEPGQSRWETRSWVARGGSPLHAWLFFIGFVFFPLWWAAAFISTPTTRRLGGTDAEKGVMLDDPQVEHDAKSWRFRCRVMAIVSLITYIPFIALTVVFTGR